jgi:hypothetical protein
MHVHILLNVMEVFMNLDISINIYLKKGGLMRTIMQNLKLLAHSIGILMDVYQCKKFYTKDLD